MYAPLPSAMQLTVVTWNDQVVNIQVRSYRQTGVGKARLHCARSCTREHVGCGPRCSAFSWPVPGTAAFQDPGKTLEQAHGMTWGVAWRSHLSCHTVCRTDKHHALQCAMRYTAALASSACAHQLHPSPQLLSPALPPPVHVSVEWQHRYQGRESYLHLRAQTGFLDLLNATHSLS